MAETGIVRPENPLLAAFTVPWGGFVAAFVYYTVLTMVSIGVEQLPAAFIAASYLLPVAGYAIVLVARLVQAIASIEVDIGPTPSLLLH